MGQGSNAQKIPFARSLNRTAVKEILNQVQVEGKELPCSIVSVVGWIVTVNIELDTDFTIPQITVPVFNSNYDYIPYQVGDKGTLMSIDTYLGGMSGLGGGTAQLGILPNLTAVGFVPVGNKEWPAPAKPNVRIVQGPEGVIIQTLDGTTSLIELLEDQIKLTRGSCSILIEDSGMTATGDLEVDGDLHVTGDLTVDGSTALGGGSQQAIKLADGSNSTKVTAS